VELLSAFSGLERIAIIGGAMLVGFWGYRMFATDRTPALIFMGIACAVLFGALFTGGSHIKNVGESYQLATASGTAPDADLPQLPGPAPVDVAEAPIAVVAEPEPAPLDEPAMEPLEPFEPEETAADTAPPDTPAPDIQDLLSSQELGGRIISVKSESVTLEWVPNSSEQDQ